MRDRKKFWLLPIVLVMLLFGGLLILEPGLGGRTLHLHAVLSAGAMRILGISAFYHDSAAALVEDGAHRRRRAGGALHAARSTIPAFRARRRYCLEEARCSPDELDHVAFYDKPFLKFERLLETYLAFAPARLHARFSMAMPLWLREKLFQKRLLTKELQRARRRMSTGRGKLLFSEHHLSHAASAFYPSPFEEAAILTMDGVGEWATTSAGARPGQRPRRSLKEIHFPHSLGLLYSAFTYYTGFKVNSGEYKVMGLAPYGEPKYAS